MTLDYGRPAPPANTNHDHVYTTLLGVLGFFMLIGMVALVTLDKRETTDAAAKGLFLLPLASEGCFLAAVIVVLAIRLAFPAYRRSPTIGLNIVLLLFPLGTALGIYGLWKADKGIDGGV